MFNVAMPLLRKLWDRRFRVFDVSETGCVPVGATAVQPQPQPSAAQPSRSSS